MANNVLISNYLTRQVVRQRNSVTLAEWSASEVATAIPPTPPDSFVRLRVLAEAIPANLDFYTTQTLAYFVQDPGAVSNILQFISADNDDPTEATLATTNNGIITAFAQRYADSAINAQQVADWRTRNGL